MRVCCLVEGVAEGIGSVLERHRAQPPDTVARGLVKSNAWGVLPGRGYLGRPMQEAEGEAA